jgi:type I restriction-modification system DNA methylase subunit
VDYIREFNMKLQALDRSKSIETVFRDFLTLGTYALAQPFYQSNEIEQQFNRIISEYTKEQAEEFSKLLALLVSAFEVEFRDFLGEVFTHNSFGSANKGQFFTPYRVSKMMSQMTGYNVKKYQRSDIMTLCEPCCGSGGMIIAFAEAMLESGMNFQERLYVEATDIDELCFEMTYIQLSILGIPAKVIWGDSLSQEHREFLYTPFYFLANFPKKLEEREKVDKVRKIFADLNTVPVEEEMPKINTIEAGQLKLF